VSVLRDSLATGVYPIIDAGLCAARGLDPRAVAAACLRAGARVLQLRVKTGSAREFLGLADDLVGSAAPAGALVIVNDRADIARMAGAGGVHLGQDDLPPAGARMVIGGGIIGLSTHDERQVDRAVRAAVDYIAVGPVYATDSKATGYDPRGTGLVAYAARTDAPVVAIGGITLERAPAVVAAGAAAVAVISDLLVTGDVEARTRAYLHALAR
jgi:thiamine-phosphate pyrophosphorylase